jgi:hypothetical protein
VDCGDYMSCRAIHHTSIALRLPLLTTNESTWGIATRPVQPQQQQPLLRLFLLS